LEISRRTFLSGVATAAAANFLPQSSLSATMIHGLMTGGESGSHVQTLDSGWEYFQGPLDGPWEVWRGEEIAHWNQVTLPHCFNSLDACDPDTPYYRGQGWYRCHIRPANPFANGRTLLHFLGAGMDTKVFVGRELVGSHLGGYGEFVVDITEALGHPSIATAAQKDGIPLSVMCDNSPNLERVPSDLSDFCLYGGLKRHVQLVYVPSVSIEAVHLHVDYVPGGTGKVSVRARIYNPTSQSDSLDMQIQVDDHAGKQVFTTNVSRRPWAGEVVLADFAVPDPQLWSPSKPNLYSCTVTLKSAAGTCTVRERFGIRHAEFVEHGPFKLNGERLLLRGTHRHEDHAGFAAAMPDDLIRKEMEMIRAMGANFIRLGHYQQSRQVLDLCDELGLLVWEEVPWCRSGVGDEVFQHQTRSMLQDMIDQHFNHPAIILWGLGNEDDWPDEYPATDHDAIRRFMGDLNQLAHQLDPSRNTSFRRCDFARDIPDVYSPSIWAGWYRGSYTEYQRTLETERERVKRLLHVEWGADSHARRHSENPDAALAKIVTGTGTDERGLAYLPTGGEARISRDGDWSESYACNLFDWHLHVQEKLPWLTGAAQWIFKDFASPLRVENPVPRVNQKGVVERDLTPKESYYVFQSYWTDKPMAHIYGHSWPVRWGDEGEQRMVKVYSNCPSAELFVNGKSAGIRERDRQNFPAAGLRWMVSLNPGKNHVRVEARKGEATVTDEIEFEYQTEKWGKPTQFRLAEIARSNGTAIVQATLFDANGVRCLDSRAQVRLSIAGPGSLKDNLGTSNGSRVVQLYNGRVELSVSLQKGASVVGITSDGIPSAFLSLKE
jgi:beta-galactosidase